MTTLIRQTQAFLHNEDGLAPVESAILLSLIVFACMIFVELAWPENKPHQ